MHSPLADPDRMDLVVIRENSEGLYPGREGDLKRALPHLRDRFGRGLDRYGHRRFAVKGVMCAGADGIARFACEVARKRKAGGGSGRRSCSRPQASCMC